MKNERKELKRENKAFKEENTWVSLIVSKHRMEMKIKLDALQVSRERLEVEQKRLIADIPSAFKLNP